MQLKIGYIDCRIDGHIHIDELTGLKMAILLWLNGATVAGCWRVRKRKVSAVEMGLQFANLNRRYDKR